MCLVSKGQTGNSVPASGDNGATVQGPHQASTTAILARIWVKGQEKENQIKCRGWGWGWGGQDLKIGESSDNVEEQITKNKAKT